MPPLELLRSYLSRRDEIVERIQGLLNAQRKPAEYLQDSELLGQEFEDCFAHSGPPEGGHYILRELEEAHWKAGFRPREIPGLHNGSADPAELMTRAFYLWQQTRWPGRAGRVRYAQTLFNLYIVRCLELLSIQLVPVQDVLDELWRTSPEDQPVLVRDARWLIQLGQSLATDDLSAYFVLAGKIAGSFSADDRIEIHKAGVRMAAGHLRSQIRYHATKKNASLNEASVVLSTRESNALDFALLIQELVPLFDAYEQAVESGDTAQRLALADAILQAVSPDPELFLNRVDLLGPYSMLEHIFIAVDRNGHASYTPLGRRHVQFIEEYKARLARVATPLADDCPQFKPLAGGYSPYGVLYGFSEDLIKHMVLKAVQPDAEIRFSLEDVFTAGGADKLAWVNGWRRLPHLPADAAKLFDYPQQFAEDVFDRIDRALRKRVSGEQMKTGRLEIRDAGVVELPDLYIRTASDSWEGKNLVSWQTSGGWRAISKSILTEVLGAGGDVTIAGLSASAAETLKLMCPGLH